MSLQAGTILGQYEIRSPLGAGGMGEVYRAHDTRLAREVAIKVLPQSLTSDPDRLRRFEQEARAAAALNHPNILVVYQMASQDGVSYLVSELLEGDTLRERLRRGPIPPRKAIDYEVQIAQGLAAAHEKGIVHRDLKPENLFITKNDRVKILDFGLAKLTQTKTPLSASDALTQATDPGVVVGTAGYMSPEQVRGEHPDHRSDIFAFGTILYEVVTGTQPFRRPTSAETMTAILNQEPPAISQVATDVPPGLQRVVHRCLEKAPEQRFQSASDLAFALEALSDPAMSSHATVRAQKESGLKRSRLVVVGVPAVILICAAALAYLVLLPAPAPVLSNYVQLTHDGQPKILVATDGTRLYLLFGSGYHGISETSVSGGELRTSPILTSSNMQPRALSPDGSQILVVEAQSLPAKGPFWSLPVLGGPPRRLGDLVGQDAIWSPDDKWLAYSNGGDLFIAKADGTDPHKIATKAGGSIQRLTWSPDGTHLRFTDEDFSVSISSLWEVAADGSDMHPLLPGWHNAPHECCGRWTADGKFFVFQASGQIWALPQSGSLFHRPAKPIQLTFSPMGLSDPVPSKDGKKLFVVGATTRGELVRFDSKSGQFVPFLGGISAEYVSLSHDGQSLAYVSFPEGTLWRSKSDGSERQQLTYSSQYVLLPRWSPDDKEILFESPTRKPSRIYAVSSQGGSTRELMPNDLHSQGDPNWSPDGKKIVFAGDAADAASAIQIIDLATEQVSTLPGSQGMFSPRWSPDGRRIAAMSSDSRRLMLFDVQTQKWTEIVTGTFGWPNWSKDGTWLFAVSREANGDFVVKIRMRDHKTERVTDIKNFALTGYYGYSLALAPDDSPLLLKDAGTYDVYSLDWQSQ